MFATVAGGTDSGRLDATVAAPGPHDFAVRELSVSSGEDHLTLAAAIASRAQRVVTIMIRPSAGQDGRKVVPIYGIVKSYFGKIVGQASRMRLADGHVCFALRADLGEANRQVGLGPIPVASTCSEIRALCGAVHTGKP